VHPDVRTAVVTALVIFWGLFALLTLSVIAEDGFDVLTVTSVVILALLGPPLFSSLRDR
jgi:hypothetical protein